MPRFTLDQISKMPAAIQNQVIAAQNASAVPESKPTSNPAPETLSESIRGPAYVPIPVVRFILNNWGAAFAVCANETQRAKVTKNCVDSLAKLEQFPSSIP